MIKLEHDTKGSMSDSQSENQANEHKQMHNKANKINIHGNINGNPNDKMKELDLDLTIAATNPQNYNTWFDYISNKPKIKRSNKPVGQRNSQLRHDKNNHKVPNMDNSNSVNFDTFAAHLVRYVGCLTRKLVTIFACLIFCFNVKEYIKNIHEYGAANKLHHTTINGTIRLS